MPGRTRLLFTVFFSFLCLHAVAQDDEFCNALGAIANDAPNKFRNVKGKVLQDNSNAVTWECMIKVPGTISSRFVASMGLFYEGAVFQTKNKEELRAMYDKYQGLLNACLRPLEYRMTLTPNFTATMEGFKKVVFMKETKEDIKPENAPAHMTMEALYRKESGLYTIVIYVFEH